MPFNPNAVPYDRLIEKTDSVSSSSVSSELSTLERVGITGVFHYFKSLRAQFQMNGELYCSLTGNLATKELNEILGSDFI